MIKSWIFELPANDVQLDKPATGSAYDWFFRIWDRIEALNFEGIFLSEHHLSWGLNPSPNLLLAALAMRTKRLRLGAMTLVAPMYHPARIAEELAMLDHLSEGRLEIGLARGSNPLEVETIGVAAAEMQPRFLEALDVVEGALTATEPFNYDGKFYKCHNLTVNPRTLQQPLPPRWISVVSPESCALAARRGYKVCGGFLSADRINENFNVYRAAAAAAGRKVSPDDLAIRRLVIVDEDGDAARARAKTSFRSDYKDRGPVEGAVPSWFSSDETVAGTPAEVAENLLSQCDRTGAGNILIYGGVPLLRPVFTNTIELFGREVLPRLRDHVWSRERVSTTAEAVA
jgi:alkanesulfonate monooxygenase SsuD/methylene tetrahydromethanopterin reductase-like flavin-dependent oxidoreductase (luciferase family)